MSKEILAIPEEHLAEFCKVLRTGIECSSSINIEHKQGLEEWLDETEEYVQRMADEEAEDET